MEPITDVPHQVAVLKSEAHLIKNFLKPKFCYLDSRFYRNDNFSGNPDASIGEFFSIKMAGCRNSKPNGPALP